MTSKQLIGLTLLILACAAAGVWHQLSPSPSPSPSHDSRWFQADTINSALLPSTPSNFIAWGDPNNDGFPDLWAGNHGADATLFINHAGVLQDETETWGIDRKGDSHGAVWADFNNDGHQDLVELRGGARGRGKGAGNSLYLNTGGRFTNIAEEAGLSLAGMRGRTPLWYDFDADNQLDLLITAAFKEENGPAILRQDSMYFSNANNSLGFDGISGSNYAQIAYTGDKAPKLILNRNNYPGTIYSLHPGRLNKGEIPSIKNYKNVRDSLWADLNGDLIDDLIIVQGSTDSEFRHIDSKRIEAFLVKPATDEVAHIEFKGPRKIELSIYPHSKVWWNRFVVHIGGVPLPRKALGKQVRRDGLHFEATANNLAHDKLKPFDTERALNINYDATTETWRISIHGKGHENASIIVQGETAFSQVSLTPEVVGPAPRSKLYLSSPAGYVQVSLPPVISRCQGITAGDFDNDMDLDLFFVCGSALNNTKDWVVENDGRGNFTLKRHERFKSAHGVADSVITADYNRDGVLDLVVSNGASTAPFNMGPLQFFHGVSQGNNWLQVGLRPPKGIAFPFGTRLTVTAGGVQQARTVGGGIHAGGQNDQVEHFGLGRASSIDKLELLWPDGRSHSVTNIDVNQRYHLDKSFYQH